MRGRIHESEQGPLSMERRRFPGLLTAIAMMPAGVLAQPAPNFSGVWNLSNERATARRGLIENGTALQRVREPLSAPLDGTGKQTLIYLKETPQI
jgi:hypothetical protein